jgi:hypothetical protein
LDNSYDTIDLDSSSSGSEIGALNDIPRRIWPSTLPSEPTPLEKSLKRLEARVVHLEQKVFQSEGGRRRNRVTRRSEKHKRKSTRRRKNAF